MRRARVLVVLSVLALLMSDWAAAQDQSAGGRPGGDGRGGRGSSIIPGSRAVQYRQSGALQSSYSIPGGSIFYSYGGASAACEFRYFERGLLPGDPDVEVIGRSQRWVFRELYGSAGRIDVIGDLEAALVALGLDPASFAELTRPLADAARRFNVGCVGENERGAFVDFTRYGYVDVDTTDPFLDPRPRVDHLLNSLQLERPVLYRNPVVDEWGGLVVRYPVWLAIGESAWRPQRSNVEYWRGWELALLTTPARLDFVVDYRPSDGQDGVAAFRGVVACVGSDDAATSGAGIVPARPSDLPVQSEPGVNGLCQWTPPGKGTVTITAEITFDVTFWVSGFTEPLPPYVLRSEPETYDVGELAAVNVNDPTG